MMKQQFYNRLYHELKRKWDAIRSVTDWTVALYIVIPALVFSGMYYQSLWTKTLSIEEITYFYIGFFIFYFITYGRGVRSFFEEADSLFLIQYPSHMNRFLRYGMLYTCIRIGITNMIVTVIMLPLFLKVLQASIVQVGLFWVFLTMFRFMLALFVRYIDVHMKRRWLIAITKIVSFFIGILCLGHCMFFVFKRPSYTILYAIIFVFVCFFLIKEKRNYQHVFYKEVEKEKEESMRWTMRVMQASGQVAKPSSSSKPWMFPRSKKILGNHPESRIIESFLKEYFRSSVSCGFYVKIVAISAIGVITTPWWIAGMLLSFSCYAIVHYSRDYWEEFTKKMFLQLHCDEGKLLWMRGKANRYLLLPALIVYGIVIAAHFYILPAIIAGVVILIAIGWIVLVP